MTKGRRVKAGNFSAVIRGFMSPENPRWASYEAGTRRNWAYQLVLAEEVLGHLSVDEIRPRHVQAALDGLAHVPGRQEIFRKALKAVEKWAIVRDLLPLPITYGTELIEHHGGHTPWNDEQVRIGETHASPLLSRAITLAANTGQRGSDLVRLSPTDIEVYRGTPGFQVRQQKTGRELWVPLTAELQRKLEGWERRPGPYLAPLTRPKLSLMFMRERDHVEALKPLAGLVMHGLRATAAVRLRRLGATESQIAAMLGMDVQTIRTYCKLSDQKENALAAVTFLDDHRKDKGETG